MWTSHSAFVIFFVVFQVAAFDDGWLGVGSFPGDGFLFFLLHFVTPLGMIMPEKSACIPGYKAESNGA